MTIDELRSQWQTATLTADPHTAHETERRVMSRKADTLRGRYYRLCLRMAALSACGIGGMIPFAHTAPVLTLLAICFFVIMACLKVWQAIEVRKIDLGAMNVRQCISAVCRLERMRVIQRVAGMTMAIPLLIYMVTVFAEAYGPFIVYGCAAGIVIGLSIGLIINRSATTLLRRMKEEMDGSASDSCEDDASRF